MRKFLSAALVCIGLSACASAGTKVDPSALQQFQKGVTTYADVVAAVGEPTNVTTGPDGKKVAVYSYAQTKVRAETFIPYIGPFVGGADTTATAIVFRFDANEKLVDYSTSVSKAGAGMGFAAQ
jgi:hypothetical protein